MTEHPIDYLQNFATNTDDFTHLSMGEIKGKYHIPRGSKEEFWNCYLDTIVNEDNMERLCILEKPQENTILIFDFDIKKKLKHNKPKILYKKTCVKLVIGIIQNILRKYIANLKEWDLCCVFLTKSPYINSDGLCSSGFHLHFPYIALNFKDIQTYIYNELNNECRKLCEHSQLFMDLKYDVDVKLDTGVVKLPWLMYGSRKNKDAEPYMCEKIYTSNQNISNQKSITMWQAFKHYALYNVFDQKIELNEDNIEYYFPRIMSIIPKIHLCRTIQKPSLDLTNDIFEKAEKYSKRLVETTELCSKDIPDIRKLLNMLNYDRCATYNDWVQIGSLLHNLSIQFDNDEDAEEMRVLWHDFSKLCDDKYDEQECDFKWNSFRKNNYTIGSLYYFASIDNPIAFKEFKNSKIDDIIEKIGMSGTQRDVAVILHKMYNQEFICADIKTKSWFHFRGHFWVEDQEGRTLRNYMSDKLKARYSGIMSNLYKVISDSEVDKNEKERVEGKIKQINKIIHNLGTNSFKMGVLKECADIFYDENFFNMLDKNPYVIAFKNGVFDLKKHILRDGRPEDYISKFIPHDYVQFTYNDPIVKELLEVIRKTFPDDELRIYFMNTTCEFYEGFNKRKIVIVWSGEGHNGKSVMMKILEYSMGRFIIKGPTTLITGKKPPSGQACPELSRSTGARGMIFDEPNKKEVINGGMLKLISGGDTFFARGLFKDGGEIEPFFKIIIICNDKPKIDSEDKALFNRLRVLPFESTFKHDCPATEREQFEQKIFPRDNELLETKYKTYAQAFNWLMLENYKRLREHPSEAKFEPHKVLVATEEYRRDNDVFSQFIFENIIEDKNSILSIKTIFDLYKDWYKSSYPGSNVCSRPEFQEYLTKRWGKMLPGIKWCGYRIRNEDDDIIKETPVREKRKTSNKSNSSSSKRKHNNNDDKLSINDNDDLEDALSINDDADSISVKIIPNVTGKKGYRSTTTSRASSVCSQ